MPETPDPTGPDERDALTLIVRDVHNYDGRPGHLSLSGADAARIADAILAAGYSRTPRPVAEVPPGPCWAPAPVAWPNGVEPRCELRAGHAGAHECDRGSMGGTAVWTDTPRPVTVSEEAIEDAIHNHLSEYLSWRDGDADGSDHWIECPVPELAGFVAEHLSSGQSEADIRARALREAAETLSHWLQADSVPAPVVVRQLYDLATMAERGDDR